MNCGNSCNDLVQTSNLYKFMYQGKTNEEIKSFCKCITFVLRFFHLIFEMFLEVSFELI